MEKKKFTEDSTLEEILKHHESGEILAKYKVPCLGCPMAGFEISALRIGDVAKMYGIDLKGLLKELNKMKSKK